MWYKMKTQKRSNPKWEMLGLSQCLHCKAGLGGVWGYVEVNEDGICKDCHKWSFN